MKYTRGEYRMKERGDDSMRWVSTRTEKVKKGTAMLRPVLVIALLGAFVIAGLICMPGQAQATTPIASCGDCHGNPPVDNAAGRDAATGRFPGSHDQHAGTYAYPCANCHVSPNYSWYSHQDGNIQVQSLSAGSYSRGASFPATNAFSPGTCSNTYCHSKGTGGTLMTNDPRAVAANTSPLWGTVTTLACTTCHGNETGNPGNGSPWYTTTGNGSGGGTKANSHQGHASAAVCQRCHYATTSTGNTITSVGRHANRTYDVVAGTGITFTYAWATNGGTCSSISCHGGGNMRWGTGTADCISCHSASTTKTLGSGGTIRQVVGTGGDFNMALNWGSLAAQRQTRHLFGASTITKWDCAVCHREGWGTSAKGTGNHNDAGGLVHLRNVDTINEAAGWAIDNKAMTPAYYADLDNFCLTCHDADGARAIWVNNTNNGTVWGGAWTTKALQPFNSTNWTTQSVAGATNFVLRGSTQITAAPRNRITDVKTQFYAGTTIAGPNYNGNPSQHAVIGARYGSKNARWNTSNGLAWGTLLLKKMNTTVRAAGETAVLSCADCHLIDSGSGAHGGTITYNLRWSSMDTACWACHASVVYNDAAASSGISRINHGNLCNGNPMDGTNWSSWGGKCMNCHAGATWNGVNWGSGNFAGSRNNYGGIHGAWGTYQVWGSTNGGVSQKYRFFPGSYMKGGPRNTAGNMDNAWNTGNLQWYCYFPGGAGDGYAMCGQHNDGPGSTGCIGSTRYSRPTRY